MQHMNTGLKVIIWTCCQFCIKCKSDPTNVARMISYCCIHDHFKRLKIINGRLFCYSIGFFYYYHKGLPVPTEDLILIPWILCFKPYQFYARIFSKTAPSICKNFSNFTDCVLNLINIFLVDDFISVFELLEFFLFLGFWFIQVCSHKLRKILTSKFHGLYTTDC